MYMYRFIHFPPPPPPPHPALPSAPSPSARISFLPSLPLRNFIIPYSSPPPFLLALSPALPFPSPPTLLLPLLLPSP